MAPARLPVRLPDGTVGGFVLVSTGSELVEPGALEVNRTLDAIRRTFPAATVAHALEAHGALLTWRGLTTWGDNRSDPAARARKRKRDKRIAAELAHLRDLLRPCTELNSTSAKARADVARALWTLSKDAWGRIMLAWVTDAGVAPIFLRENWSGGRGWNPDEAPGQRRDARRQAAVNPDAPLPAEAEVEFIAAALELAGSREVPGERGDPVKIKNRLTPLRARRLYEIANPGSGRPPADAEHFFLAKLAILWWRLADVRPTLTSGKARGRLRPEREILSRFEAFVRAVIEAADEPRPRITRSHLEHVLPRYRQRPAKQRPSLPAADQ